MAYIICHTERLDDQGKVSFTQVYDIPPLIIYWSMTTGSLTFLTVF